MRLLAGLFLPAALAAGPACAADPAQIQRGHEVFDHWCQPCHGTGPGKPGTIALEAKYHGSPPAALEQRTDLTPEAVRTFVRQGVTIMPFFRKTEIGDADLDALAAYLTQKK